MDKFFYRLTVQTVIKGIITAIITLFSVTLLYTLFVTVLQPVSAKFDYWLQAVSVLVIAVITCFMIITVKDDYTTSDTYTYSVGRFWSDRVYKRKKVRWLSVELMMLPLLLAAAGTPITIGCLVCPRQSGAQTWTMATRAIPLAPMSAVGWQAALFPTTVLPSTRFGIKPPWVPGLMLITTTATGHRQQLPSNWKPNTAVPTAPVTPSLRSCPSVRSARERTAAPFTIADKTPPAILC